MATNFFITSTMWKRIQRIKQPIITKHIKAKCESGADLIGTSEFRNGFVIEKKKSVGGARFIWRIVKQGQYVLYVLRDCLLHDQYARRYNTGTVNKWSKMTALSEVERSELGLAFAKLSQTGNINL